MTDGRGKKRMWACSWEMLNEKHLSRCKMTIVLGVKKQINRSEWVSDERELIEFLMVVTHVDDEEDQRLDAGGSWFMMLKCWYSLMTVNLL